LNMLTGGASSGVLPQRRQHLRRVRRSLDARGHAGGAVRIGAPISCSLERLKEPSSVPVVGYRTVFPSFLAHGIKLLIDCSVRLLPGSHPIMCSQDALGHGPRDH
jgi:hypothetical protein